MSRILSLFRHAEVDELRLDERELAAGHRQPHRIAVSDGNRPDEAAQAVRRAERSLRRHLGDRRVALVDDVDLQRRGLRILAPRLQLAEPVALCRPRADRAAGDRAGGIRVRAAANAGTGWVKCRAFEVNTNRAASDEGPAGAPSLTTNLPTYSAYFPEFMSDSDPNTYFWSSRGGQKGDYFEIDLGAVVSVSRITFKTGVPAHAADYVQSGELCYSSDGHTWTTIRAISGRDTVVDVNIRARYIRVNITANQTSWITVSGCVT